MTWRETAPDRVRVRLEGDLGGAEPVLGGAEERGLSRFQEARELGVHPVEVLLA